MTKEEFDKVLESPLYKTYPNDSLGDMAQRYFTAQESMKSMHTMLSKYEQRLKEDEDEIKLHKSYAVAMVTIMRDAAREFEHVFDGMDTNFQDDRLNQIAHMVMQLNACADDYSNIILQKHHNDCVAPFTCSGCPAWYKKTRCNEAIGKHL
jgi:predicted  nucleic acid-binding Zn-ribbon protein